MNAVPFLAMRIFSFGITLIAVKAIVDLERQKIVLRATKIAHLLDQIGRAEVFDTLSPDPPPMSSSSPLANTKIVVFEEIHVFVFEEIQIVVFEETQVLIISTCKYATESSQIIKSAVD